MEHLGGYLPDDQGLSLLGFRAQYASTGLSSHRSSMSGLVAIQENDFLRLISSRGHRVSRHPILFSAFQSDFRDPCSIG
jgi:hypothetical protein